MNAKEIVIEHLKKIGADGLCRNGCGCGIGDLVACGSDFSECVPAKLHKCTPGCDHFFGEGTDYYQEMKDPTEKP